MAMKEFSARLHMTKSLADDRTLQCKRLEFKKTNQNQVLESLNKDLDRKERQERKYLNLFNEAKLRFDHECQCKALLTDEVTRLHALKYQRQKEIQIAKSTFTKQQYEFKQANLRHLGMKKETEAVSRKLEQTLQQLQQQQIQHAENQAAIKRLTETLAQLKHEMDTSKDMVFGSLAPVSEDLLQQKAALYREGIASSVSASAARRMRGSSSSLGQLSQSLSSSTGQFTGQRQL
eukprot:gnl/Spiro4/13274_TR7050_c0_g1_i1.p1 gnl/Spiro4/13274_TR7050_c0_g1~~gnl/Spiro4/13274_TR7050_c0_g1_i1.p1  ORF type:complete len:260 (+),score=57.97 gnl/Spiro4/13274_TR7050_c0_g1_i1:79-780(+)